MSLTGCVERSPILLMTWFPRGRMSGSTADPRLRALAMSSPCITLPGLRMLFGPTWALNAFKRPSRSLRRIWLALPAK